MKETSNVVVTCQVIQTVLFSFGLLLFRTTGPSRLVRIVRGGGKKKKGAPKVVFARFGPCSIVAAEGPTSTAGLGVVNDGLGRDRTGASRNAFRLFWLRSQLDPLIHAHGKGTKGFFLSASVPFLPASPLFVSSSIPIHPNSPDIFRFVSLGKEKAKQKKRQSGRPSEWAGTFLPSVHRA